MEKMNFTIEVDEAVLKERKMLIHQLKQNPLVQQFCKEKDCVSLIDSYPYRFKEWLEGISLCQKCAGLQSCRQENQGKVYDLVYSDYLDFVLRPCKYSVKKKEEESHLPMIIINDMPSVLYSMSMEQIEIDAENAACIQEVVSWLKEPQIQGLYLRGAVGVGKSTLAAIAVNYYAKKGKRVAYVNVPNWVARMKGLFDEPGEIQKQIRILQKLDFVIFDDIGAESVTAWVRDELLFPILNGRMEEKKATWFTSNEDFESLYAHYSFSSKYGEEEMKALRIMERIKTLAKSVKLSGKNRRNS